MKKKILLKNGIVVDPFNNIKEKLDVLIEGNIIRKVAKNITDSNAELNDVSNNYIFPGLIDMHVHLREPGREDQEKISTGTRSAAMGGITSVVCMPNTNPVIDTQASVKLIQHIAENEGIVKVFCTGSITKGRKGEELTEIGDLKSIGVVAITDDGSSVMNANIMRRALEYSKMFDLPVVSHCEDLNLTKDGVANEGYYSMICGFRGIPNASEDVVVSRDIILSKLSKGHLHIAHVSTGGAVKLINEAKKEGVTVTAEATPHHLFLNDEKLSIFDSNYKMKPPLRAENDRKEVVRGLKNGIIDCIVSDHAPHTIFEKEQEFDLTPFGIIGLETTVPLVFTNLVHKKIILVEDVIKKMTINPAKILRLDIKGIKEGEPADITVVDPELEAVYKKEDCASKSINSPFFGMKLKGYPVMTIVEGKMIMKDRRLLV